MVMMIEMKSTWLDVGVRSPLLVKRWQAAVMPCLTVLDQMVELVIVSPCMRETSRQGGNSSC